MNLYESTLIIITAKHGQSPIDPSVTLRIPGDKLEFGAAFPGSFACWHGSWPTGRPAIEDDVSLMWLTDQRSTKADAATLAASRSLFGDGEIFAGNSLKLSFSDPALDSALRTSSSRPTWAWSIPEEPRRYPSLAVLPTTIAVFSTSSPSPDYLAASIPERWRPDRSLPQCCKSWIRSRRLASRTKGRNRSITLSLPGGAKIEGLYSGPGAGRNRGGSRH
jgi:hypothetical protein